MGYQRGSEEFYKGPAGSYNPDTLSLLQAQQRRMLDQQERQGNLYAQGVEESGRDIGSMIGNAPTAYMRGATFKQQGEKHQADMDQAERMGRMTEGQIKGVGLQNDSLGIRNSMDASRRDYMLGSEEGSTEPRANKVYAAEVDQPGLQNEEARANIAHMKAMTSQGNLAQQQFAEQKRRQALDDQATVDAAWRQENGLVMPAPRVGTPEGDAYLAKALGNQKFGSMQATQNVTGASTVTGEADLKRVQQINSKLDAIQTLEDAQAKLEDTKNYPQGSSARAALNAEIAKAMREIDPNNEYNPIERFNPSLSMPGWTGSNWWQNPQEQVSQSVQQAKNDLASKIKILEATGSGMPQVQQAQARYQALLAKLHGTDQESQENKELDYLLTNPLPAPGQNKSAVKPAMSVGKPGGKPSPLFGRRQQQGQR